MVLLAITADTWIVTGLGFGIVLALLFCLVFILQFFGWTMQKATAPRKPKEEKPATVQETQVQETVEQEPKANANANADDEIAAVAYALYLMHNANSKHDIPTAMISLNTHETAWNTKSIGLNNVGF